MIGIMYTVTMVGASVDRKKVQSLLQVHCTKPDLVLPGGNG